MTEQITKACPKCGQLLTIRRNRKDDSEFLGCTNYPECTYTEPLPETIKLRRQGYKDMFEDEEL